MIKLNKKSFGKQHAKSFVIGQNFNYQLLINDHLKLKIFGNNTINTKKTKRRFNNYLGACNFIQRTSINSYCLLPFIFLTDSFLHFSVFKGVLKKQKFFRLSLFFSVFKGVFKKPKFF